MVKWTMRLLREAAARAGKDVVFNRQLGGYQIRAGFNTSEAEIPSRTKSGKLFLNEAQLKRLARYISGFINSDS